MWPFNKKAQQPTWDAEAFQAKQRAEAEEKARTMPATHVCEVKGDIHEACDVGSYLVSKTTGKVLGWNFGGVKVVGLIVSDEQGKARADILGLMDKLLSSDSAFVAFERNAGCSGEWIITGTVNARQHRLSLYRGWRWLNMGQESQVEITTDEYETIVKRLTNRIGPATMAQLLALGR